MAGGAWVFRGTRLPVATVIENLEDLSVDEVIEQFDVTREQARAVLDSWLRASALPSSPPVLVLFYHGTPKGLARAMTTMLVGVRPTDPATFVAMSLVFFIIAALSARLPARRAAGLDPIAVLSEG